MGNQWCWFYILSWSAIFLFWNKYLALQLYNGYVTLPGGI